MSINHVLIRTKHLAEMTHFLTNVISLRQGYRPPFLFSGAWIYDNHKPLIHLVESNAGDTSQKQYLGSNEFHGAGAVDHVALDGDNYAELIARLKRYQVSFTERTVPLTREHQVFVHGPENIKLEIIFTENKRSASH